MSGRLRPLQLVIRGVDKLSGPIGDANTKIRSMLKPVRDVERAFGRLGRGLRLNAVAASARNVGSELKALGRSAGGLLLGGGLFGAGALAGIKHFIDYGDEIGATAVKLGVGTTALQEMRYAGEQLDIEQEVLEKGLFRFNRSLGEASRKAGPMRTLFAKLGIDARTMKDPLLGIEKIATKLVGLSTKQQTSILTRIYGKDAGKFINFFSQGPEGIKKFRKEAEDLGFVLSEKTIAALGEADNEQRKLKYAALGLGAVVGTELLPEIRKVIVETTVWIEKNKDVLKPKLVEGLRAFAHAVEVTSTALLGFTDVMGGVGHVLMLAATVWTFKLNLALISLATNLGATGLTTMAAFPMTIAFVALAAAVYQVWKNWDQLKQAFENPGETLRPILDNYRRSFGMETSEDVALRNMQERSARTRVPLTAAARDYAAKKNLVSGQIGLQIGTAKGVHARVTSIEATAGLDLNVGQSMVPGT